jgi:hypothetical protein
MLFGNVEIPEALLEALQNNKLVVFAGAGVSMGKPANYPNFSKLAKDINRGTLDLYRFIKIEIDEKDEREKEVWIEPIDRFLGLVEEKGINVKKSACQLLNLRDSKPTILHQNLVKLFKIPDKLRLITTNFDPLFNDYALELWKSNSPEYYYAPALPLGNDFNGIVYLHGSVLKNEKHIVITDRDFGRAYLTEGWARNFLQAMFSEYTVLFIGYSYGDPVIPYLTRGLPPRLNHSNFTFINDEDNADRWKYLGIQPIIYPKNYSSEDPHEALGICLQSWVEHIEMGALQHEHRIKEIVSSPSPPLEPKDLSYIKNVLKDITKIGHFIKHCNKTLDWLYWANREEVFNELFQLNSPVSDISNQMSWWLAQYIVDYPEETLMFFQSKGFFLSRQLWCLFFDKIWRTDDARMEPNIFLKWIIFLLHDCQVQYKVDFNSIDYLLKKCKYPEDKQAALLLFEYLTKPQWANNHEISLVGDPYWFKEAWQDFFKPNLSGFAINLEPIVTSHLQKASWMTNAIYRDNENFCFLSGFRLTIEPYQDTSDYRIRDIDILIDAARDILENLLIETPHYAHGIIDGWNISGIRILQRLAIHGIIKSVQLSADEKIQWLIQNDLIVYYYSFEDEIYRLIKNTYLLASNTIRLSLLEEIENLHSPENPRCQNNLINHEYDYFNILNRLYKLFPKCDLLAQKLEKIKKEFPKLESEERSDITYVPITTEELLEKNLADIDTIDWLLTYDEQVNWRSRRGYLLEEIQKGVIQDFEWSYQLAKAIQERQNWSSDIWLVILLGWQNSKFTEEQWEQILAFFVDYPQLYIFRDRIVDLLRDRIVDLLNVRQEQSEIHLSCFSLAKELTKSLWEIGKTNTQKMREDFDWLLQAINNDGGKITLLWLQMLSKERQELEKVAQKIPNYYQVNFNKILEEKDYQAELARVILCSQLNFLFSLDPNWTRENIIPLFGWKTEKKQAQQAWCGFLMWGKCNGQILSDLMPLYKQTFSHLVVDLNYRENARLFCNQIVAILIYASPSSFDEGDRGKLAFISDFIKQVNPTIRKQFAWTISSSLREIKDDVIKNLWNKWLKAYWEERNIGRPLALESGEIEEMIIWLTYLKPVFNEAVDLFCESPIFADSRLIDSFGVRQLEKDQYYTMLYPESLSKLLLHLLKNISLNKISYFNEVEKIFRQLINTEVSRGELRKICDELSRLNCPNALKLNELLNNEE